MVLLSCNFQLKIDLITGADTGFPVGGGASFWGGAPTYKFAGFSQKLQEIKKNLVRRGGGRSPGAPPWIRH